VLDALDVECFKYFYQVQMCHRCIFYEYFHCAHMKTLLFQRFGIKRIQSPKEFVGR